MICNVASSFIDCILKQYEGIGAIYYDIPGIVY